MVGADQADAEDSIEEAGLRVGEVIQVFSDEPEGQVIGQHPPPATEVVLHATVDIVVSMGPEEKNED